MTIVWRSASGIFADTLYETVKNLEAPNSRDRLQLQSGLATPTIGIGFDLQAGGKAVQQAVLSMMGFNITAWPGTPLAAGTPQAKDQQYIQSLLTLFNASDVRQADYDAIMAKRKADIAADVAYGNYITGVQRGTFTFANDAEVRSVFDSLWNTVYSKKIFALLDASITADATFLASKELIALACTVWVGTWGPKAAAALNQGNRAQAWYEFRYGWKESTATVNNPNNGWAKRHYFESAMLGLYGDPTNTSATPD